MSEKERSIARLMAAASVLGLSLGMTAANAEQVKHHDGQTTTQIKGQSQQDKWKTNEHKGQTGVLRHNNDASTQSKHMTGMHKRTVPSTELNPQPEPPKPVSGSSIQGKHSEGANEINPQPEPPAPEVTGTPQQH